MISAIILAAGEASRMGKLKQLLPWEDSTILGTVIKNIQESRLEGQIRVVLGAESDRIKRELSDYNCQFLTNPDYTRGMFSSVMTGIQNLPETTTGLLFMLADQPLVTTGIYNKLINYFKEEEPLLLVPSYKKRRGHPLIISAELIPEIHKLGEDGDPEGGLRSLLDKYEDDIEYYNVDKEGVIIDLDYYEDYQKYYSDHHS
ncbi:nucleotidyltransferase family protein [Halanaerobiaceae bacterium Z-7014]|uniref:Nucleotidyltransferase family protein n=1 Tax=Halonatronomonas betaini TaxID=2778430 RepID=A0A931FBM5_9FIRM|nr:nucleotidyltransferase family protein [Halonatronomonas betaini]MBF8438132.1 nucleotidyltransferase family protein [Halonatronomonas betaini]